MNGEYNLAEAKLARENIVGSLSTIESVFRSYRQQLTNVSGKIAFTQKEDQSLVTQLDLEIENAVKSEVGRRYPALAVYGEETGYGKGDDSSFWLVDPIDGTKSFVDGVPTFSNMAALIEDGETIAAIIYNPSRDDIYTAVKGEGTLKNGVRVDLTLIDPDRVILCKNEFSVAIEAFLSPVQMRAEAPPSGGGDGFTKVLDGLAAARFQMHASGVAHDYAPGALLVAEASGIIIPIKDREYTYETRSFVACHPSVANLIIENIDTLRELDR